MSPTLESLGFCFVSQEAMPPSRVQAVSSLSLPQVMRIQRLLSQVGGMMRLPM